MTRIKAFEQFVHLTDDPPEHVAYLVHLDPPYIPEGCENDRSKWVCHYLGSTETWRLMERVFSDHGTVNGARVLQVQREAGGTWHLVRTWAGGRDKEVQLKQRSGTSYCPEPQCAGEHARPGSSWPTGRYTTRRQREAAQRAREAQQADAVRDARQTTYEEMQKQFRGSKEISDAAFWELQPHIERLEARWLRELREKQLSPQSHACPAPAAAPDTAASREEDQMFRRQHRAAEREHAQQEARAQAEADALFAEADRLDDLTGQPYSYRQQITAERAARIRAQLGADLVLGDADQLAAVPGEAARLHGACMSAGCDCAYGHPDRPAERHAAAEPGWVDAARWIPGQERDEKEMAGELLSEHVAHAEDAWRRERTATADEHLAQLAHDERALGWARQDAQMAREARESATRSAYATAADMQRSALGPELDDGSGRSPLPRVLQTSPATLAPIAATLPDGTPHADPFLAGRGWQAQGGVYVRQAQAQTEAV
jgi:hypothetical protein